MIDVISLAAGIAGALGNGGWALRLESQAAALRERVDGIDRIVDDRHETLERRLERIENKLDSLPRDLRELLTGRKAAD